MIILDTDVLIEILDKKSDRGDGALKKVLQTDENIGITSINLHEILYGLLKYAKPVEEVMGLPVLNYTKKDAGLSAKLEVEAESRGFPIRRSDAMIAAITINNGARLFTLDFQHFVPVRAFGLKLFE